MTSEFIEDTEDNLCPLCLEELDITDKNFKPCQCGYQMCRFCWHHIQEEEELNARCPACRTPYESENYIFTPPDPVELAKLEKHKKERDKMRKNQEANARKHLSNVRVIQRNLVYVTNLSLNVAREDLLKKFEYFGQYGKIVKVVVNRSNIYNANTSQGPSVSAYITYARKEDALAAIQAVDGTTVEGRVLRASFGTTKYCSYFLRNLPCNNPDCMYLHEIGGDRDSFTKEDMALGKHHIHEQMISPVPPGKAMSNRKTVLPPPGTRTSLAVSTSSLGGSFNNLSQSGSSVPIASNTETIGPPTKAWNVPTVATPSILNPEEWPTTLDVAQGLHVVATSPPHSNGPRSIATSAPLVINSKPTQSALPATSSWGSRNSTLSRSPSDQVSPRVAGSALGGSLPQAWGFSPNENPPSTTPKSGLNTSSNSVPAPRKGSLGPTPVNPPAQKVKEVEVDDTGLSPLTQPIQTPQATQSAQPPRTTTPPGFTVAAILASKPGAPASSSLPPHPVAAPTTTSTQQVPRTITPPPGIPLPMSSSGMLKPPPGFPEPKNLPVAEAAKSVKYPPGARKSEGLLPPPTTSPPPEQETTSFTRIGKQSAELKKDPSETDTGSPFGLFGPVHQGKFTDAAKGSWGGWGGSMDSWSNTSAVKEPEPMELPDVDQFPWSENPAMGIVDLLLKENEDAGKVAPAVVPKYTPALKPAPIVQPHHPIVQPPIAAPSEAMFWGMPRSSRSRFDFARDGEQDEESASLFGGVADPGILAAKPKLTGEPVPRFEPRQTTGILPTPNIPPSSAYSLPHTRPPPGFVMNPTQSPDDWQNSFRAMLPGVKISFALEEQQQLQQLQQQQNAAALMQQHVSTDTHKSQITPQPTLFSQSTIPANNNQARPKTKAPPPGIVAPVHHPANNAEYEDDTPYSILTREPPIQDKVQLSKSERLQTIKKSEPLAEPPGFSSKKAAAISRPQVQQPFLQTAPITSAPRKTNEPQINPSVLHPNPPSEAARKGAPPPQQLPFQDPAILGAGVAYMMNEHHWPYRGAPPQQIPFPVPTQSVPPMSRGIVPMMTTPQSRPPPGIPFNPPTTQTVGPPTTVPTTFASPPPQHELATPALGGAKDVTSSSVVPPTSADPKSKAKKQRAKQVPSPQNTANINTTTTTVTTNNNSNNYNKHTNNNTTTHANGAITNSNTKSKATVPPPTVHIENNVHTKEQVQTEESTTPETASPPSEQTEEEEEVEEKKEDKKKSKKKEKKARLEKEKAEKLKQQQLQKEKETKERELREQRERERELQREQQQREREREQREREKELREQQQKELQQREKEQKKKDKPQKKEKPAQQPQPPQQPQPQQSQQSQQQQHKTKDSNTIPVPISLLHTELNGHHPHSHSSTAAASTTSTSPTISNFSIGDVNIKFRNETTMNGEEIGFTVEVGGVGTNAAVESLEKEVANARKQVKEWEDKLQEVKLRNGIYHL